MHKLLVVDDEKLIREGMRRTLESLGLFELFTAGSGVEALQVMQNHVIDAMLLDISMPDMDGLELMRQIRGSEARPFTIIISGFEEFAYAQKALSYGAVDYLLKPVDSGDVAQIGRRLNALIEQRSAQNEKERMLHAFVLDHREGIKQKLLTDILDGQIAGRALQDMSELYGLQLDGEHFMAVVAYLRRAHDAVSEVDFQVALKQFEERLGEFVARPRGFFVNLFNMENARYVLLLAAKAPFDGGAIQQILDALLDCAGKVSGLKCYVGKGDAVRGIENLAASYAHANEALDYRSMFGSGVVYDIGDYRKDEHVMALMRILDEMQGHLRFQRYPQAQERLEACFAYLSGNRRAISQGLLRFFALKCMLSLTSVLVENGLDAPDGFWQDVLMPRGQMNERALGRVQARALRLLDVARQAVFAGYKEQHEQLAGQVKRHIEENYRDNRLSVNRMSLLMNYSPNYLGNVFKRAYGLSISDHINQYRVLCAKRLMDETDMMVYEIAFQVGFNDQHYFSKTFKRYEGVSPTEYRNQR